MAISDHGGRGQDITDRMRQRADGSPTVDEDEDDAGEDEPADETPRRFGRGHAAGHGTSRGWEGRDE